ncbi:hypothetical protein WJX79_007645 [Trebouxia sp. C0005]
MQHPNFVAAEDSDDDMTDMEDDLHLANVDVDKTTPGCQAPQVATSKQLASQSSAQAAADAPDQLAAFETITQGIVQGLQDVPGISCAILDSYVQIHYPGVKKALLTPSAAFTGSITRMTTSGFIQVVSGPAPLGFAKMRYEPTKKAGVAPAREIAKIVAWVDKLASKPKGKEPDPKETKWRQRAADAIVLHCMHDLLAWGGVHTNVLKQALKKIDRKRQVHRCLSLNMKNIDSVVRDLVQRGALEWGGAGLVSKAQHENPETCNIKLRCMHPVSLTELLAAYSVFDLCLPDHVASAALDQFESNEHPNGHPTHPESAQTEPSLGKTDLHTSVSLGAVTGAAAPAYATQMDAPNCDFDASATAKAATAAAAVAAEQNIAGDATAVDTGSLTSDRPSSQQSTDAVLSKKTNTEGSDPALKGLLLAVEEDRGRSKAMPQQQSAGKSRLHHELMQFSALASPTEVERQAVSDAVKAVTDVAKAIWPQSCTVLFGSQATTLALPGSDLDIVILGVSENITNAASGFTKTQRDFLGELLEDLLEAFKAINLLKGKAKIIDARVPIIKCTLDFGSGLAADISLGAANGAAAVQYVCQMVAAAPPLRVLVLVIKALLKETMLNEVFTGDLLISFFERFGAGFDYSRHAVSVGRGGIVEKKRAWKQDKRPWLLAVEDPQQLGKDIGSGSYSIRNVQQLFAAAASTLKDCPDHHTEQDQWAAVQADGASSSAAVESFQEKFPLLSELIVVETAVGRDRSAAKKRQQQAKQAPHQTRLSVLPTHTRLRHHLSLSPPAAPVKPSFHVGKKGRKPPVTLQVAQGELKRQRKKGIAQKAREKSRAHLHRAQTRSQDASPVALPSDDGGSSMQVTDVRDHFPPAAHQPKRRKKARKAQRQAERSAAPMPHAITKKQKRKANKAKSQLEQASQSSSGRGRAVEAGGVSKKRGGKFANRNKK